MDIPEEFHALLDSTAVALVGTLGPRGEPQVTPSWFLWDQGVVRFSLVEGRQRLRNLRRDPRLAVTIIDPARPTWYVELRGHVDELRRDPDLTLERRVSVKYTGAWQDGAPAGTPRWVAGVVVEHVTSQRGHG